MQVCEDEILIKNNLLNYLCGDEIAMQIRPFLFYSAEYVYLNLMILLRA